MTTIATLPETSLPPRIRVFIALHEVPDSEPPERAAEHAGVTMTELREAMTSLWQREPDPEA
jgi:hypothetical protein